METGSTWQSHMERVFFGSKVSKTIEGRKTVLSWQSHVQIPSVLGETFAWQRLQQHDFCQLIIFAGKYHGIGLSWDFAAKLLNLLA